MRIKRVFELHKAAFEIRSFQREIKLKKCQATRLVALVYLHGICLVIGNFHNLSDLIINYQFDPPARHRCHQAMKCNHWFHWRLSYSRFEPKIIIKSILLWDTLCPFNDVDNILCHKILVAQIETKMSLKRVEQFSNECLIIFVWSMRGMQLMFARIFRWNIFTNKFPVEKSFFM